MDIEDNDLGETLDPKLEATAREMGWRPQEEFRGDPEKWVDASTFVERGEHVLPIVRAERDRLRRDLLTRDEKIGTLEERLMDTQTILRGLQTSYDEKLQRELAAQKIELRRQIKEAREDNDVDTELDLRDQLTQLGDAEKEAQERAKQNKEKLETTPKKGESFSPEFLEWKRDNSWYGGDSPEDKKRTKAIIRIAEDLRDDGDTSVGLEFMNKCMNVLLEREGGSSSRQAKVEGSHSRGSGAEGQPRSYASLPPEAKQACEADVDSFVGEGKKFSTKKDWQTYYAKLYYGE